MKNILGLFTVALVIGLLSVGCSPTPSTDTSEEQQVAQVEQPAEQPVEQPAEPAEEPAEQLDPAEWDGWYVNRAEWVASKREFKTSEEEGALPGGGTALTARTSLGDDRVRDLYLAHQMTGLEAGKTYKISLDYKFDAEEVDPSALEGDPFVSLQSFKAKNYIQYAVKDGDHQDKDAIADVEDYPERPVPETKYVPKETIGDGQFHSLEITHTVGEGQNSATVMMIVRFRAKRASNNEFLFGNLK
ncbi:MAG: hypothetical protein JXR73_03500, partial [Candidatus Omnitrophica bacterium]|nr:hypothetical protein [Candidatus Omnitrophota bacterium]